MIKKKKNKKNKAIKFAYISQYKQVPSLKEKNTIKK